MKVRYTKYYDVNKADIIIDAATRDIVYVTGEKNNPTVNILGLANDAERLNKRNGSITVYEGRSDPSKVENFIRENKPKGVNVYLFSFSDFTTPSFVLVDNTYLITDIERTPEELEEYRAEDDEPDKDPLPAYCVSTEPEDIKKALDIIAKLNKIAKLI